MSDIHGNSLALRAVLADFALAGGADGYWFQGDYVVMGPDPAGVLEQIHALPHTRFIRGNNEVYISDGAPLAGAIKDTPQMCY
jgi:hypothetical protein